MKKQNYKDRRNEHLGMERREEKREHEGKMLGGGKFANMPDQVVMKEYPKAGYSGDVHLDDSIVRLDGDADDAAEKVRRNRPQSMY